MEPWSLAQAGVVTLPDGRRVRGRSLRAGPVSDDDAADFGVYLTTRPHRERWESRWVRWPDFRLPSDRSDALLAIHEAYERSGEERVEIGCGGGTGRTGTALAILARHAGVPADEAVAWVRGVYRRGAVETPGQRRLVRTAGLG